MRLMTAAVVAALAAAAALTLWQVRQPAPAGCVGWTVTAGPDHGPVVVVPATAPCAPAGTEARP